MDNIFLAVFIPITTGIVEVIKQFTGEKSSRFLPLISLITGLVITLGVSPLSFSLTDKIIYGLIVGLSASGLYDGAKTLITKPDTGFQVSPKIEDKNSTRG
jgi:hypothetical protein